MLFLSIGRSTEFYNLAVEFYHFTGVATGNGFSSLVPVVKIEAKPGYDLNGYIPTRL
jgi:hypothetical protein